MTLNLPINAIDLDRGDSGLGFNIKGGIDAPLFHSDFGIFVTKVREKGAAFKDGRIKEGDKIVEINGSVILNVTHNEAVSLFVNAGNTVKLKVQHQAEKYLLEQLEKESLMKASGRRSPWRFLAGLVIISALGVGGYFGYKKWKMS